MTVETLTNIYSVLCKIMITEIKNSDDWWADRIVANASDAAMFVSELIVIVLNR